MRTVITKEIASFIRENSQLLSIRKIADACSISRDAVKRFLNKNNIEVSEDLRKKWKIEAMTGRTTFTPEEDEVLKGNYLDIPVKRLAALLNRSGCGINSRLRQLNLKIPPELAKQRKESGMIRKGAVPPNKGKKWEDIMSPEAIERCKTTQFKKNHLPHNSKKDFEEVQRKDSSGYMYLMIKLPENRKLIYKHIWLWEQENNRKLPAGYNIVFKNGNSLDCRIENLECISNAELMQRNTMHRFPEDLRKIIQLKGALKRQINKLEKNG